MTRLIYGKKPYQYDARLNVIHFGPHELFPAEEVLAHELAHSKLHQNRPSKDPRLEEVEAVVYTYAKGWAIDLLDWIEIASDSWNVSQDGIITYLERGARSLRNTRKIKNAEYHEIYDYLRTLREELQDNE